MIYIINRNNIHITLIVSVEAVTYMMESEYGANLKILHNNNMERHKTIRKMCRNFLGALKKILGAMDIWCLGFVQVCICFCSIRETLFLSRRCSYAINSGGSWCSSWCFR
jgi:hypothetical protein